MLNRERGTAHVNLYFFLVLLLLFMGTLFFGYSQLQRADLAEADRVAAASEAQTAERDRLQYQHYAEAITGAVGLEGEWTDTFNYADIGDGSTPDPLQAHSNPTEVTARMSDLARRLGIPESQAASLPQLIDQVLIEHGRLTDSTASLESDRKQAQTDAATARTAFSEANATMKGEFDALSASFTSSTESLEQTVSDQESTIESQQDEIRQKNDEIATLNDQHATALIALRKERDRFVGQLAAVQSKLRLINPPDQADGEIITASAKTQLAWVNLGRRDMLQLGTQFRITDTAGTLKGYGRVTKTEQDRAELQLFDVVDSVRDPILQGDKLFNALYSPNLKRDIALIGRFTYPYSKSMLKIQLEELGNKVHDKVQLGVDLVIVGLQDPNEDGSGLKPVDEIEGYQEAMAFNIEVITVQQIRDLLRLGSN